MAIRQSWDCLTMLGMASSPYFSRHQRLRKLRRSAIRACTGLHDSTKDSVDTDRAKRPGRSEAEAREKAPAEGQ